LCAKYLRGYQYFCRCPHCFLNLLLQHYSTTFVAPVSLPTVGVYLCGSVFFADHYNTACGLSDVTSNLLTPVVPHYPLHCLLLNVYSIIRSLSDVASPLRSLIIVCSRGALPNNRDESCSLLGLPFVSLSLSCLLCYTNACPPFNIVDKSPALD